MGRQEPGTSSGSGRSALRAKVMSMAEAFVEARAMDFCDMFEDAVEEPGFDAALEAAAVSVVARWGEGVYPALVLAMCELASNVEWEDEGGSDFVADLFAVPVTGPMDEMGLLSEPEVMETLAESLVESGLAAPDARIFLMPLPFTTGQMAQAGPAAIRRALEAACAVIEGGGEGGPAVASELADALVPAFGRTADPHDVEAAERCFVGVRLARDGREGTGEDSVDFLDALTLNSRPRNDGDTEVLDLWRDMAMGVLPEGVAFMFPSTLPRAAAAMEAVRLHGELLDEARCHGVWLDVESSFDEVHICFENGSFFVQAVIDGRILGPARSTLLPSLSDGGWFIDEVAAMGSEPFFHASTQTMPKVRN